jgi:hypothetical protein
VGAVEPAPIKREPISTIQETTTAAGLKAPPPHVAPIVPSPENRRASATSTVYRRGDDEAVIATLLAALGPEVARRAGLVKSGHLGTAAHTVPASASTPGSGGPR